MVKIHPMWEHFPKIQVFLEECLELIIEKTTIENKDIRKTVTNLIESQGKLLRPAYLFLFSQLGNPSKEDYKKLSLRLPQLKSCIWRRLFMTIS